MTRLLFTFALTALLVGSAYAGPHKSKHQSSVTTGQSSDRPQSPLSSSSGQVTHSDEQARGLVPGNTSADGGESRNTRN